MSEALRIIAGAVVLLAAAGILAILYHQMMRKTWEETVRAEFEERYDREIEKRWRNQDIRVRSRIVIQDETGGPHDRSHEKLAV